MGIQLNRVVPAAPPGAFRTFSASQPLPTHWRRAGCIEVRCEHHLSGWTTAVVPDSDEERLLIRACVGHPQHRQPDEPDTDDGPHRVEQGGHDLTQTLESVHYSTPYLVRCSRSRI